MSNETRSRRRRVASAGPTQDAQPPAQPASRSRRRASASAPAGQTTPPSTGTPRQRKATTGNPLLRRGDDITEGAEKAKREAEGSNRQPFRFYLKGGTDCDIIILDDSLGAGVAFWEHSIWPTGAKGPTYSLCRKEIGECACCQSGDNSYYVAYLSVLVLKTFVAKQGTPQERTITQSKMLLPIKRTQLEDFKKLERANNGSLRGMYLVMERGTDDMAPRIGKPVILEGGRLFDVIPEEELDAEYGHDALMSDDNKTVLREENYDITPFDYEAIFQMPEPPSETTGRRRSATAGSREEAEQEYNQGDAQPEAEQPRRRRRAVATDGDPLAEGA